MKREKRGQFSLLSVGLFILFLVFILFLLPIASAQYENYESLEMENRISATFQLIPGDSPSIQYITANVSFFPKSFDSGARQELKNTVSQIPEEQIEYGQDSILFTWEALDDYYSYAIDSDIKTSSSITKVKKKVDFPVQNLPIETSQYLSASEFIDINDAISNKALQIVGDEDDLYIVLFRLANWTQNNIQYNLTTLTAKSVQKSSWVLEHKEGVCDEITNLFISFSRSLGIPARFVSGRAYSNIIKGFGNHGWAEVYLPDYGWIPFDVTFGQFGWMDPTHIKFKDSVDPSESSTSLEWKGKDVSINAQEPNIITSIKGGKEAEGQGIISMHITPIWESVAEGSYVPLLVEIKSNVEYYLPLTLHLTTAPGLVGSNSKSLVLKPYGEATGFWILMVPLAIEKDVIYTTKIEVESRYAGNSSELKYAEDYEHYSLQEAEEMLASLLPEEGIKLLEDASITCETEEGFYYAGEEAVIVCIVEVQGEMRDVKICFDKECKSFEKIDGQFSTSFSSYYEASRTFIAYVESGGLRKYAYAGLNIIMPPDITAELVEPALINYKEKINAKIRLQTEGPAKNVSIEIEGIRASGSMEIAEVGRELTVTFPIRGSEFYDGNINLQISYYDEVGKSYYSEQLLRIEVAGVPFYLRFYLWVRDLFV